MPCMKRVYKDKQALVHWSAARTNSASRPGDKPVVNRGFCSSNGLHRISLVRASEELFRTVVFDALEGTRDGCVLREQTRRRPILPGPPRPAAPPCAARPDPWCVRVLNSTCNRKNNDNNNDNNNRNNNKDNGHYNNNKHNNTNNNTNNTISKDNTTTNNNHNPTTTTTTTNNNKQGITIIIIILLLLIIITVIRITLLINQHISKHN